MPKLSYTDAKLQTWKNITRNPKLAQWVREDPHLQQLLASLVREFGVLEVELDPKPGIPYEPLRNVQEEPHQKPRRRR